MTDRAAAVVAAATASTGAGQWLGWLPSEDIGKIATVIGVVLSMVLITTHILKMRTILLEYRITQAKEATRVQEAADRRAKGLPTRRASDRGPDEQGGSRTDCRRADDTQ